MTPEMKLVPAPATREPIGTSDGLRRVLDQVGIVAPVDSTVLIQGETGTGKEMIAQAIHDRSPRVHGPFVKVNCGAIPAGLLESELFGYERGAFTGALSHRIGRFQLANRGTLFLDEIGDLPIELQPKLLRVLQEQEFERLGSSHTTRVDVRIVAATNQNLEQMVADRRFRADLFYRLNVFPISMPPLRDRRDDIPLLVNHFVGEFSRRFHKIIEVIPLCVMDALSRHDWPGNIRELQNVLERAVLLNHGSELQLPFSGSSRMTPADPGRGDRTLREMEQHYITEVLRKTNWVVSGRSGAAVRLGLPRTTLTSRMRKLGISLRKEATLPRNAA